MKYIDAQIATTTARVIYWQTLILSGEYKKRKVWHYDETPLTHEELLTDSMGILNSHVQFLQQLTDRVGELESEEPKLELPLPRPERLHKGSDICSCGHTRDLHRPGQPRGQCTYSIPFEYASICNCDCFRYPEETTEKP